MLSPAFDALFTIQSGRRPEPTLADRALPFVADVPKRDLAGGIESKGVEEEDVQQPKSMADVLVDIELCEDKNKRCGTRLEMVKVIQSNLKKPRSQRRHFLLRMLRWMERSKKELEQKIFEVEDLNQRFSREKDRLMGHFQ